MPYYKCSNIGNCPQAGATVELTADAMGAPPPCPECRENTLSEVAGPGMPTRLKALGGVGVVALLALVAWGLTGGKDSPPPPSKPDTAPSPDPKLGNPSPIPTPGAPPIPDQAPPTRHDPAPPGEAQRYFDSGYGLWRDGIKEKSPPERERYFRDAIEKFDQGVKAATTSDHPLVAKIYMHRGLAKRYLNDPMAAEADYDLATKENTGDPLPYYNWAVLRLDQGGNKEIGTVLKYLGKALELDWKDNSEQNIHCDDLKKDFSSIWKNSRFRTVLAERHVTCP